MNSNLKAILKNNPTLLLSSLWIYLSLNYIYCDHLGIMEPETFKGLYNGQVGSITVTQPFLMAAALLLQIPFMIVVLSQILNYKANRLMNIIAATLMLIVQIGTMSMGTSPSAVYIFYSVVEVIINTIIIWIAWSWKMPANQNESNVV
jgi:hypothetical protein